MPSVYQERDDARGRGGRRDDVRGSPLTPTEISVGPAGDEQRGRGHTQSLGDVAPRRLGRNPLREQHTSIEIGQRVLEHGHLVPQVEVHTGGVRRARHPATPGDRQRVSSRRSESPIAEQAVPGDLTHTIQRALEQHERCAAADGEQFHVDERGVGGDDGEGDPGRARVHPGGLDRAHRDGERAPSGFVKGRQLGRREPARVELRERIPLDRRAEVQHGGVAFPRERETGAEILVRVDALVRRHLERPVGRDDLTQQRQRPLDLEPLVELVRLHQQLLRAALRGQRGRRADREQRRPDEPPHPAPRVRSVTRPSDSVPPGSITTVVSNGS